jgi:hypothetical protein
MTIISPKLNLSLSKIFWMTLLSSTFYGPLCRSEILFTPSLGQSIGMIEQTKPTPATSYGTLMGWNLGLKGGQRYNNFFELGVDYYYAQAGLKVKNQDYIGDYDIVQNAAGIYLGLFAESPLNFTISYFPYNSIKETDQGSWTGRSIRLELSHLNQAYTRLGVMVEQGTFDKWTPANPNSTKNVLRNDTNWEVLTITFMISFPLPINLSEARGSYASSDE